MNDCNSGCKKATKYTPVKIHNPAGLSSLSYRVGTHARFKADLLANISSQKALSKLTARDDTDLSIALMDSWATVADVLTFYQERIANEGFLRTATQRMSVLELARSIGYELRPGVAAHAYLSFTMDSSPVSPKKTVIGMGTKVQSIPAQNEMPQVFETIEEIEARQEWNEMQPRLTKKQELIEAVKNGKVVFDGTSTKLKTGDYLLFVTYENPFYFEKIKEVEVDAELNQTHVKFSSQDVTLPTGTIETLSDDTSKKIIDSDASFEWSNLKNIMKGELTESELQTEATLNGWSVDEIVNAVNSERNRKDAETKDGVYVFRVKCGVFGNNAPKWESLPANQRYGEFIKTDTNKTPATEESKYVDPVYPYDWDEDLVSVNKNSRRISYGDGMICLDNTYQGILPDSWITLQNSTTASAYHISDTSEKTMTDFALTARVTGLTLDKGWKNISMKSSGSGKTSFYLHVSFIAVGKNPYRIAVNPKINKVYVANYGDGTISVIDGDNPDSKPKSIAVGKNPYRIAVNPKTNKVYVTNSGSDTVSVIDGDNPDSKPKSIAVGKNPYRIAVNPKTNKVYVTNFGSDTVSVIDGDNPDSKPKSIAVGSNPSHIAVNPETNKVYVANSGSGNASIINGNTDLVTNTISVGKNPHDIAVNPKTNKVYVTNYDSSTVSVINGSTNSVTDAIPVGSNPFHIAVNPKTNKVYVTNFGSDTVSVIDGDNPDSKPKTISVGKSPFHIAVNPETNKVYVTNSGSDSVSVINGSTNSATDTIPIGKNPFHIEVNPETNKIYVANHGDGTVSVIDGEMDDLSKFGFRETTVYAMPEKLVLADISIDEAVKDQKIVLNSMIGGLTTGRPILVSGELKDQPGIKRNETVFLSDIIHFENENPALTTLHLQNPLDYAYKRDTVKINANIANATHGETKKEAIGSGDPTSRFQQFMLKQSPLTHIPSSTPSGIASTLEIRVDGVRWNNVASFEGLGNYDNTYLTHTDNDARTRIIFGDSISGRLPPAGQENIRAEYRVGIGSSGMLGKDQLTLLMTRPLGVRGVTNPLKTSGGADPENLNDARKNAPRTVLTLDRLVSLYDFKNFAQGFAGIGKATSYVAKIGGTDVVVVAVATQQGGQVSMYLCEKLANAINLYKDPTTQFIIKPFNEMWFNVEAKILVSDDRVFEDVRVKVENTLKEAFSFDNRDFGQAVTISEVISIMQSVEGVEAIDVDSLYNVNNECKSKESIVRATGKEDVDKVLKPSLLLINKNGIKLEEMK